MCFIVLKLKDKNTKIGENKTKDLRFYQNGNFAFLTFFHKIKFDKEDMFIRLEKNFRVPDGNRTYGLLNNGWTVYPTELRETRGELGHFSRFIWYTSCILLGSAMSKASQV